MSAPKFPSIKHLTFSPEIHRDDKELATNEHFLSTPIVILEKLDGSNYCLQGNNVYARSHAVNAITEDFDIIKAWWAARSRLVDPTHAIYCENVYAKHSIYYSRLPSFFFVFNILQHNKIWLSWEETLKVCVKHRLPVVPCLFNGEFTSEQELQSWMDEKVKLASEFGPEREGFVIRRKESFIFDKLGENMGKYVRKGHVQSENHWSKQIIPNKLLRQNLF